MVIVKGGWVVAGDIEEDLKDCVGLHVDVAGKIDFCVSRGRRCEQDHEQEAKGKGSKGGHGLGEGLRVEGGWRRCWQCGWRWWGWVKRREVRVVKGGRDDIGGGMRDGGGYGENMTKGASGEEVSWWRVQ